MCACASRWLSPAAAWQWIDTPQVASKGSLRLPWNLVDCLAMKAPTKQFGSGILSTRRWSYAKSSTRRGFPCIVLVYAHWLSSVLCEEAFSVAFHPSHLNLLLLFSACVVPQGIELVVLHCTLSLLGGQTRRVSLDRGLCRQSAFDEPAHGGFQNLQRDSNQGYRFAIALLRFALGKPRLLRGLPRVPL